MGARIEIPHDRIAEFCRRWRVRKMSLFGSVIRDDFTPESDVDVLVEFQPGPTPGLRFYGAMPNELSHILGRVVDLNTAQDLRGCFVQEVLDEAEVIHDQA